MDGLKKMDLIASAFKRQKWTKAWQMNTCLVLKDIVPTGDVQKKKAIAVALPLRHTKKGYSGVMTLTKEEPLSVVHGCGIPEYDREGRFVLLDFGQWSLLNVYIPSGSSGEDRHEFKMKFLDRTLPFFKECIRKYKNLIVVGDYNIVHEDIDIHNPERKDMPSGFRPEERSWLHTWFSELFVDSFRVIHPSVQEFSWWSYRAGSYDKNKGWRIDYHSITPGLKDSVKSFEHQRKYRFSDHCPLVAEYEI